MNYDENIVEELDLGFNHTIAWVPRDKWGALAAMTSPTAYHQVTSPATVVRLTTTGGNKCHGLEPCIRTVKELQRQHFEAGFSDITHSFLIGGDANSLVFEGRGFLAVPIMPIEFGDLGAKCFDIAIIGNYEFEEPPYCLMKLALDMIRSCIRRKILSPKFELVNQIGQ